MYASVVDERLLSKLTENTGLADVEARPGVCLECAVMPSIVVPTIVSYGCPRNSLLVMSMWIWRGLSQRRALVRASVERHDDRSYRRCCAVSNLAGYVAYIHLAGGCVDVEVCL